MMRVLCFSTDDYENMEFKLNGLQKFVSSVSLFLLFFVI